MRALTAELKALVERDAISRRAWVNVWDVPSNHQYLLLPSDRESELHAMARHRGASVLGMSTGDVTVAATIGATRGEPGHHPKTEVSFFAASSRDIRERLVPLAEAGFLVDGVTTPCGALWSQARLRQPLLPGDVHAHVAIGQSQSALGIFSDGALLYARDLNWGYAVEAADVQATDDRERLAERLAAELQRSLLFLRQYWDRELSQVLLCGDMPDIRSLTAPLINRLGVHVETLDTPEGIDAESVPAGFSERAATFRLASAIAAEPPPANLLPTEVTAARTSETGRHIVAAGTAAAVAFGAFLYAQAGVRRTEAERELAVLQRTLSSLPRDVTPANVKGGESEVEAARSAALNAIDAQGPAMARIVDALGRIPLQDATLRSVHVLPERDGWKVNVVAFAADRDPVVAGQHADDFLRAIAGAAALGTPLEGPNRRMVAKPGGVESTASYRMSK